MKECCVVVPIYKIELLDYEKASFQQCIDILYQYDIIIVTYKELSIHDFLQLFDTSKNQIRIEFFNEEFFTNGINGYNHLMMNIDFYRRFYEYEYMLIYQLDAWVFRDELLIWCNKKYDYIGAPVYDYTDNYLDFVGNGGFSLRRISYYIKVLSRKLPLLRQYNEFKEPMLNAIFHRIGYHNTIKYFLKNYKYNEDVFFSKILLRSFLPPRVPNIDEALHFSIERKPALQFERIGKELPFGCHAFHRNEFDIFWKKYININIG